MILNYNNFKQTPSTWRVLFVYLLLNVVSINAQNQNHWVVPNVARLEYTLDTTDFAYDFDFNIEPPRIKVIHNFQGAVENLIRSFTYSDNYGQLNLYSDVGLGFLNSKNQTINNKLWLSSTGSATGFAQIFSTASDSQLLIVYREDSLGWDNQYIKMNNDGGEMIVKYGLYNTNQQKFVFFNKEVDFKNPYFNHFKWKFVYSSVGSYNLFNQFIDEKTGNYYLFFNIADTIFTSRYNPSDMTFSMPYYSGLNCERNILKNSTALQISEDFTINKQGTKAIYLNEGTRDNFVQLSKKETNYALITLDFDKTTGLFSNEQLIDYLGDQPLNQLCISPSDTIVYGVGLYQASVFKYVFNSQYQLLKKYTISISANTNGSYPIDIKLAPNGKIFMPLVKVNGNQKDSNVLVLEDPNDIDSILKINKELRLYYSDKIRSARIMMYNLPKTYGSYRRVDFSAKSNCKENGIILTNNSDTFWFKKFRYYLGNGDSLDIDLHQRTFVYNYKKPGKYWVKLKAFGNKGGWVWYSDTVIVNTAPIAYFTNKTIKGCQYLNFQFLDSSKVFQLKQDSSVQHHWQFGDGSSFQWQTKNTQEQRNQNHIYYKDGLYTVNYIVSDGYCEDTFTRINQVNILPAPKPGIVASPLKGCLPLDVTLSAKYTDVVDSTHWYSSGGHNQFNKNQIGATFTFTKVGKYKVYQTQYGASGCITHDTDDIEVIQGIDKLSSPTIIKATVNNSNETFINWFKVPNAQFYELYRNQLKIASSLTDTFYTDKNVNTNNNSYLYKIKAIDICDNSTQLSNGGKTILLTAQKDKNNICVLRWSPYHDWQNGVQTYQTLHVDVIENTIIQTTDSSFQDHTFLINGKTEKCYKIIALEKGGNNAQSESNIICVPYESVLWIPTAITINGDGINESFKINTFGIQSFTMSIYTRWGQKVYESSSIDDEWKPSSQEQGVYMYVVKAKTNDGDYITKGTVTVLR